MCTRVFLTFHAFMGNIVAGSVCLRVSAIVLDKLCACICVCAHAGPNASGCSSIALSGDTIAIGGFGRTLGTLISLYSYSTGSIVDSMLSVS